MIRRSHTMGYQKLSKEQEMQLVKEYLEGASVQSLMTKYGFASKKSITDKVKKYYPNEYRSIIEKAKANRKGYSYEMQKIDSEFDAYFLGLLLTDGYIVREREAGIDLVDEDCIKFLSTTIGKDYHTYAPASGNEKIQGKQPRHRLILSDAKLINDLSRYGVIPNKSSILQPPQLMPEEEKFIPYIIRGIIDGDGCIFATSYGAPSFYIITKSQDFGNWIVNVLENKMFMKDIRITIDKNGLYRIETANLSNINKLIALSYDKPFGMSRKYTFLRKMFRDYNNDALYEG